MKKVYLLDEEEYNEYLRSGKDLLRLQEAMANNSVIMTEMIVNPDGLYHVQVLYGEQASNKFKDLIDNKDKEIESLKCKIKNLENRGLIERILNKRL